MQPDGVLQVKEVEGRQSHTWNTVCTDAKNTRGCYNEKEQKRVEYITILSRFPSNDKSSAKIFKKNTDDSFRAPKSNLEAHGTARKKATHVKRLLCSVRRRRRRRR
jgi:hypothetical protein